MLRAKQRKTWKESVDNNWLDLKLKPGDALDCRRWKAKILQGVVVQQ